MESYIVFISPEASTYNEIINGLQCRNRKLISDYKNQQTVLTNDGTTKWKPSAIKLIDLIESSDLKIVWKDLNVVTFDALNTEKDLKKLVNITTIELSEYLYKLAETLPFPGTFHLDIIWDWTKADSLKIDDHTELFGSLKKLISWHNGFLYIIKGSSNENEDIVEWVEMLGAETVTSDFLAEMLNPWVTFWRGSVSLYNKENEISQRLLGFHLVSETANLFNDSIFVNEEDADPHSKICLSSNMEILSEFDINSVPIYIITPHMFKLTVKSDGQLQENSKNWLKNFNSQAKLGLIVRLHYSTTNSISHDKTFDTSTICWKNAIKNGNYRSSIPPLTKYTQQLNFLMIGDATGTCNIKFHLLQTSYPLLGFLNERLGIQAKIMEISRDETDTWLPTLEALPYYYDTECIADALAIIKEVQSNVLFYWKRKLDEGDDLPEMNTENIRHVFVKARQKVLEKLIDQSTKALSLVNIINEKSQPRVCEPENLDEPNNWPEKKALMNMNFESKFISNYSVLDLVSDSGKYFLTCFDKTGNAKSVRKLSTLENKIREKPISKSCSDECSFPDVHYNNDLRNADSEENVFYKSKFITDETASISSTTTTRGRLRSRISSETSDKSILRRSPRLTKCSSPIKRLRECKSTSSTTSEKNGPEKTISISSKVSSTNSEINQKRQRTSSIRKSLVKDLVNTMSEHHKMKLRNAVCTALEEHGIFRSHPLFDTCGKKLFSICSTFVQDVVAGRGRTSEQMLKIAQSHVKQVINFETEFASYRKKSTP